MGLTDGGFKNTQFANWVGDVKNVEGWYWAARCLTMKAVLIADCLTLLEDVSSEVYGLEDASK